MSVGRGLGRLGKCGRWQGFLNAGRRQARTIVPRLGFPNDPVPIDASDDDARSNGSEGQGDGETGPETVKLPLKLGEGEGKSDGQTDDPVCDDVTVMKTTSVYNPKGGY